MLPSVLISVGSTARTAGLRTAVKDMKKGNRIVATLKPSQVLCAS